MTLDAEQPAAAGGVPRSEIRLSGLQQALAAALEKQKEGDILLRMYLGALYVLHQSDNPDRFALAGHNLRELMRKILLVHAELEEGVISLGDKVATLRDKWNKAVGATSCLDGAGGWEGPVDPPLDGFLRAAAGFFEWHEQHRPKQKQEIATVLQGLDPIAIPLPTVLQDLNVDKWELIRNYFVKVAHHGSVDEEEFGQWQDACERFLIDHLQPPTFEHHSELDQLIEEAEAGDS